MERPVMHPIFTEPPDAKALARQRRRRWLSWSWRLVKRVGRMALTPVALFKRGEEARLRMEDGTLLQRFVRALLYRLAFVPVILLLFVVTFVFATTHPPRYPAETDPLTQGVYYDPVNFLSEDGTRLEGWLVPVYDARRVLEEKDRVIQTKSPAVVLVHDFGGSRQQVLPLVEPLHEMGMVVLVVSLRGNGGVRGSGQTFGLREAMDVRAAVQMLRRRAYVDPEKVCVFGLGTGANAALLAAETDPGIAALVLDRPVDGFATAFVDRIGRDQKWLVSLMPMFKWTFEMMYQVDADDLNLSSQSRTMESRPVLMFDPRRSVIPLEPHDVQGVQEFLKYHVMNPQNAGPRDTALTALPQGR